MAETLIVTRRTDPIPMLWIEPDGRLTIGEALPPADALRVFWEALAKLNPCHQVRELIVKLEAGQPYAAELQAVKAQLGM